MFIFDPSFRYNIKYNIIYILIENDFKMRIESFLLK